MKKYLILTVMLISLLATSSLAFASHTETTWMKGTLKELAVYNNTTGQWVEIFNGSQVIDLNSGSLKFKKNIEQDGLPVGTYTKVKFAFSNVFELSGKIILDNGDTYYSKGGATSGNLTDMQFSKTLSAPATWTLTVAARSQQNDDGFITWCDGTKCYTQDETFNFVIDENNGKALNWYIHKGWLWSDYNHGESFSGDGDFLRVDANTLQAPFIDGFEVDWEN